MVLPAPRCSLASRSFHEDTVEPITNSSSRASPSVSPASWPATTWPWRSGAGEVLALVGENGAGKSTLMNILAGLYQPDAGTITLNGRPVHFRDPNDAYARGIGMVHQNFMLVPNMTVTENVALGLKQLHKFMRLDLKEARRRILEVSAHHELPVNPDAYIWQLSVGEQQRVELIKTLCFGAQLLILDEPTSALTPQETDDLIDRLKRMSAELSIIFISHKLNEVKALSNRVAILRHGAVVFNGRHRRPHPGRPGRAHDRPRGGPAPERRHGRSGEADPRGP